MKKRVNINTADAKTLMSVKGIGEKTAEKIIEARDAGVEFGSIEELKKVVSYSNTFEAEIAGAFGLESTEIPTDENIRLGHDPRFSRYIVREPSEEIYGKLNHGLATTKGFEFTIQLSELGDISPKRILGVIEWAGVNKARRKTYVQRTQVRFNSEALAIVRLSEAEQKARHSMEVKLVITDVKGNVLDTSRHRPEDGDVIDIELQATELPTPQPLKVKAKKANNVDYTGYSLSWVLTERVSGRLNDRSGTLELAGANEVTIQPHAGGKMESVSITVRTSEGVPVLEETYTKADITGGGNTARVLNVDLPAPTSTQFNIVLVEDVDVITNPYADHKLVVAYDLLDSETLNIIWSGESSFDIDADGKAKVRLSHYGVVQRMTLSIRAPGGETLSQRTGLVDDLLSSDPVTIKVPPRELISNPEGFVRMPQRPDKALCRLLDPSGERIFSDVQVIFYISRAQTPIAESYTPFLAMRSENNGYFFIDLPKESFTGAFARIGVKRGSSEYIDVPIVLDMEPVQRIEGDNVVTKGDNVVTKDEGFLPAKMVLVVDTDADIKEECCDSCADEFQRDRAVLDEFSFFTVVRTSEPKIKGYTLSDEGEISIKDITDLVPNAEVATLPPELAQATVRKDVLLEHTNLRKGLTVSTLQKAIEKSNALRLRERIAPSTKNMAPGRAVLDFDTAIDWDEDPTFYQAVSLAHGHLLQFKQEWVSDGYSLGDIVYSLPLAPGQKKQIVVLDWEHRAAAERSEESDYADNLTANLTRDRDINEVVTGAVTESIRGGSTAKTSGWGAGLGIGAVVPAGPVPLGGLLGVAGGSAKSSSKAWQNSARNTTLSSSQSLRDRTSQSAASVRSQRTTVIETATQGERFSVQTESVANYNHCHSLTIQYYEVMRHLRVEQRLASVQECIFVPLILSPFSHEKTLRWREALARRLINRRFFSGFDAIERIENDYEGSDLPDERWADADLDQVWGEFTLEFRIGMPTALATAATLDEVETALAPFTFFFPSIMSRINDLVQAQAERRQEIFTELVAPEIAQALVQNLQFDARVETSSGSEYSVALPLDATLISRYQENKKLYVSVRQAGAMPAGLTRSDVAAIEIRKANSITLSDGTTLLSRLPSTANVIIHSGNMTYRTQYMQRRLFSSGRINDDLLGYSTTTGQVSNDMVRIQTPLSRYEMRNPRDEDIERAARLQSHLNDNLEYYHQAIWLGMSPERRFMFLDGIQVRDYSERDVYPGGIVRSVASVVENEVIGIVGNSLVMPVAPGFRLDPSIKGEEIDLLSLYKPQTPMDPIRISLPTKGVFAEAVMGRCNSCERIEEDRFWRWSEEPIPDSPTQILPVATDPRVQEGPDPTPTPLATPIINMQNAPAAPDPAGVNAAVSLLSNPNVFRDITGLTENQRNAIAAFQKSLSTAQAFGEQGAQLGALAAKLKAVSDARKDNAISAEDKEKYSKEIFEQELTPPSADTSSVDMGPVSRDVANEHIARNSDAPSSRLEVTRDPDGSQRLNFEVDRGSSGVSPSDRDSGASTLPSKDDDDRGSSGGLFGRGDEPETEDDGRDPLEGTRLFDNTEVNDFGADTLSADRHPLAVLTAYLSQYSNSSAVMRYARNVFSRGVMRGLGQKVRFDHISACLEDGPRTMDWLLDHAITEAASPFSGYVAAHNHMREISERERGLNYEDMALPWDRISDESTLSTAVYKARRFNDIEGSSFEDFEIAFPKGSLSDKAFFKGLDASPNNASGFYVMNLREDGIFADLENNGWGMSINDRYHYILSATVVDAIISDSVTETAGITDLAALVYDMSALNTEELKAEVKALGYAVAIHTACMIFRDNLASNINSGMDVDAPSVRAISYMNALSFFEGSAYGNIHQTSSEEAQADVQRESRIHLSGSIEALLRHGDFDPSSMRWAVPVSSLISQRVKPALEALLSDVMSNVQDAFNAGISASAIYSLGDALDTLITRLPQELGVLTDDLWPYIYEVLNADGSVSVPYAQNVGIAPVTLTTDTGAAFMLGSPEQQSLMSVSASNLTGAQPQLLSADLASIVTRLAKWLAIGFPSDQLRMDAGWVDPDAAGSEMVEPLHLVGQAVALRAQSGDLDRLGRMQVWAQLLVDDVQSGSVTLADGQVVAALLIRSTGNEGGSFLDILDPTDIIDAAAAATRNAAHRVSAGWDALADDIMQYFDIFGGDDEDLPPKVAEFQQENGMPATGELDRDTWDILQPEIFRDTSGTSGSPTVQPQNQTILHTIDKAAWLRKEGELSTTLKTSGGDAQLVPQDALVVETDRATFTEGNKTKTALKVKSASTGSNIGWTLESNLRFFWKHNLPVTLQDVPSTTLATTGLSSVKRKMAEHWNLYGGVLEQLFELELSSTLKARGCAMALAILAKEGQLFVDADTANPARPTQRFENHVFYKEWISRQSLTSSEKTTRNTSYDAHLKPRTGWRNHKYCQSGNCSTNQWNTLHPGGLSDADYADRQEAARHIAATLADQETAHKSASYGAFQTLGNGHRKHNGYATAVDLYQAYFDGRAQFVGLIDFLKSKTHTGQTLMAWIRASNFGNAYVWSRIAGGYNGDSSSPDLTVNSSGKTPYARGLRSYFGQAQALLNSIGIN